MKTMLKFGCGLGCVVSLAAWLAAAQAHGPGPAQPATLRAPAISPSPPELDRLLGERYQAAKSLLDMEQRRLKQGQGTLLQVCDAARRVRDSAVELPLSSSERIRALTNYVAMTRQLETNVARAAEVGAAAPTDLQSARYLRLDAEIALLRAQAPARP